MFRRLYNPMSMIKAVAFGFIGVFAHRMVSQYVEAPLWKWVSYIGLLAFGVSTPVAIEVTKSLLPEDSI